MDRTVGGVGLPVSRVGGHPAVDLLNTVAWRLAPQRRKDVLTDYQCVLGWARALGLVTGEEVDQLAALAAADPKRAVIEHEHVLALREDLHGALNERRPARLCVEAYRDSLSRSTIIPFGDGWEWRDEPITLATLRDRIARQVVDVFTHPKIGRFRMCEGAGCGWVYIDTSPRGDRRWCSSSDCGNRDRVRRHYHRTKQQARQD